MYTEYAKDPRMKINVGIRRRLAPLLDNGRDEIELMHAILFSLPGSPVLYYGDEVAMGDNVYLGDRDGVRTPMQWTGDRNGGFSRADFAQLYAPPLMDPVYGYQAVNVEAQLRTPTSLLRWLRRFISLRKEHPVFGFGTFEPLEPSNPRIFAHVRRYEDDVMLCVHNLARSAQAVELDLSGVRGPPPGGDLRPLALPRDRPAAVPAHARAARLLLVPARRGRARAMSEAARIVAALPEERLHEWVLEQRWFASKAREVAQLERARGGDAARGRAEAGARARRGALPDRHARALPGAARAAPGRRGMGRARDRGGRGLDGLRRARRRRARARAAAPDPRLGRRRRRARQHPLPLGRERRRRLRRHGRGAAGRRRAVQLLGRVRRGADPEGLPPARAGRQPRARAAALPVRARVRAHRAARRLVRVRRPARRRDARHAAGVPQRSARGLGALPGRPRGLRAARPRPRRR